MRHSVSHLCAQAHKCAITSVPVAVWVHMAEQGACPCANTSEHAQHEHIWAYGEGEVLQMWQPHAAAHAQVPTGAGRSAHEQAPSSRSAVCLSRQ